MTKYYKVILVAWVAVGLGCVSGVAFADQSLAQAAPAKQCAKRCIANNKFDYPPYHDYEVDNVCVSFCVDYEHSLNECTRACSY